MPTWLAEMYLEELPILDAMEQLKWINIVAYAFGSMPEQPGRIYISKLQAQARGARRPGRKKPSAEEVARRYGIPVIVRKKKERTDG